MNLEFLYGADAPNIVEIDNGLRVAVTNPACAQTSERWSLPPGNYFRLGDFHFIKSDSYILGAASIKVCPDTLAEKTHRLYDQLLTGLQDFSLYRIWHFVPQINEIPDGRLENYRAFCQGRAIAFEAHADEALHSKMPAASAVGTLGEHLTIVYLAGKSRATYIENPLQTPAYKYPEKYGPKPPAFARGASIIDKDTPTLFISGTASILASESIGDSIENQLAITIENLKVIAGQTPAQHTGTSKVRIYLRHAKDYLYVKSQLESQYLNEGDEAYYIIADICRKELLVEIEMTIGL